MKPTAKERKLAETWWSRGFDAGVADERERLKPKDEAVKPQEPQGREWTLGCIKLGGTTIVRSGEPLMFEETVTVREVPKPQPQELRDALAEMEGVK